MSTDSPSKKRINNPGAAKRPAASASRKTKWAAFWSRGAPPDWDDLTDFERYCCRFWRTSRQETVPICLNCQYGKKSKPDKGNNPDGTEREPLVPCGCSLKQSIALELMHDLDIFKFGTPGKGAAVHKEKGVPVTVGSMDEVFWKMAETMCGYSDDDEYTAEELWLKMLERCGKTVEDLFSDDEEEE